MATAQVSSSDVSILLGNGTGSFGTATNYTVNGSSKSLTSADFNGDTKLDLAVQGGSNNLSILLGNGLGSFGTATNFTLNVGDCSIVNADFNGDSKVDLATANCSTGANNVAVLLNCTAATAVNNNSFKEEIISIYPNPTSDQFFIDANTTDKLTVDLFDVNSRHVFSANVIDKSNINVTELNNGIYTLTIKTVDRVINKKLIILR